MLRFALALLLAFAGCSKKSDTDKDPAESKLGAKKDLAKVDDAKVVVTLSVDWEGAYLSPDGLKAMQEFREEWKEVPLTHFVCPAYFARGGDTEALAAQIREQVRSGDEVGLHLHSWFSLAKAAGVAPRSKPNFYGDSEEPATFDNGDKGYEVALSAYSSDELAELIATSLALLHEHGLGAPSSFRAGGYIGSPELLAAARAAKLTVDSSATWPKWFDSSRSKKAAAESDTRGIPYEQLQKAWPNIDELTQPYGIDTAAGPIIEVPNTGSFPEYASGDEMRGHLQRAMVASGAAKGPVYVNFGFHQESADEYVGILSDTLFNFQTSYPGVLRFSTVSAAASEATQD